nr:MAG TPA: hypothetical protein [Caudoviricetes sp.]
MYNDDNSVASDKSYVFSFFRRYVINEQERRNE